jgi:hypothetical protein
MRLILLLLSRTSFLWAEHVSLLESIPGSNQLPPFYPTVWRRREFSTIIRWISALENTLGDIDRT